jgi:hypothetical protein
MDVKCSMLSLYFFSHKYDSSCDFGLLLTISQNLYVCVSTEIDR